MNKKRLLRDGGFLLLTLSGAFAVNLLLQTKFQTQTMTSMIFVLGVGYRIQDGQG